MVKMVMPSRVRSHVLGDGRMSVECWCHARIVYVDAATVREGLTESCGREGCGQGEANVTKPIETHRRGNGGKRLNKLEKDDPTAALPNRGRFDGHGPCGWHEGCVWTGPLIGGLCAEHRAEQMRTARVRRWQEGRSKPTPPPVYEPDHSAPWHCRVRGCGRCEGKEGYEEWATRQRERSSRISQGSADTPGCMTDAEESGRPLA